MTDFNLTHSNSKKYIYKEMSYHLLTLIVLVPIFGVILYVGIKTRKQIKNIMATQEQLAADLEAAVEQGKKTQAEIVDVQEASTALQARVAELEAILDEGGTVSPRLEAAAAAVKAQAQVLDDQIPDVVVDPA